MREPEPPTALPAALGRFAVEGELGRGGMGVVLRGRDTRLGRSVALKTLPADAIASASRRARFEQEARLLASLTHPNIASLHSLEEDERGHLFLVLELVEGETLAHRLEAGPPALLAGVEVARPP